MRAAQGQQMWADGQLPAWVLWAPLPAPFIAPVPRGCLAPTAKLVQVTRTACLALRGWVGEGLGEYVESNRQGEWKKQILSVLSGW